MIWSLKEFKVISLTSSRLYIRTHGVKHCALAGILSVYLMWNGLRFVYFDMYLW